jgi:hypothetical protein
VYLKNCAIIISRDRTEVSALMHSPGGMTEFCETSGHIRDKASHEAGERLQFGTVFLAIIISRLEPKIEESRLMMIDNPKKPSRKPACRTT